MDVSLYFKIGRVIWPDPHEVLNRRLKCVIAMEVFVLKNLGTRENIKSLGAATVTCRRLNCAKNFRSCSHVIYSVVLLM
jgi:hypothetical protein